MNRDVDFSSPPPSFVSSSSHGQRLQVGKSAPTLFHHPTLLGVTARYRVIGSACDSGMVCAKDGRAESRANNRSRFGADGRQSNSGKRKSRKPSAQPVVTSPSPNPASVNHSCSPSKRDSSATLASIFLRWRLTQSELCMAAGRVPSSLISTIASLMPSAITSTCLCVMRRSGDDGMSAGGAFRVLSQSLFLMNVESCRSLNQ